MKFLQRLLYTKKSSLWLLDVSYIVVLLPLIVMFKVPMLVFIFCVLGIFLFRRKTNSKWLILFVFFLGVLTVYLSMYGAFSFRGLSRLKLFLELLVYVLLVVVSMQRLTREINLYLLVSPFLFLALSLFFYHGIVMLTYVVFEVFFLLWMILSHRMGGKVVEGFRSAIVMFLYSLPWVIVLFIFFPRISFEHASYGFKGETHQRMGHDGTMYLDSSALLVPSERIVMEVGFDTEIPDASALYFRGSILYVDKKNHWEPLPLYPKRKNHPDMAKVGNNISYKVTLYPTQKKWLYMLDMPSKKIVNSTLDNDLISTVEKKIDEPIHYEAHSKLNRQYKDTLDTITYKASTHYSIDQNPKTYKEAQVLKAKYANEKERAQAIMQYFQSRNLTYTLKPDLLDTNHTSDSFLFDKRRGYCVHFAASFVTMARMSGLPARVVTGYKSDKSESLNNYLAIKEKDAHAWAELYIDNHWSRFETTNGASNIDYGSINLATSKQKKEKKNPYFKKLNLYLMYMKYQVETWILYYSHVRQLQLLDYAKKNPEFVWGAVFGFIFLVILTFMVIAYFKKPSYSSKAREIMQILIVKLEKKEHKRATNETLHHYILRYINENKLIQSNENRELLENIDKEYETILYAAKEDKYALKNLKRLVKKFN